MSCKSLAELPALPISLSPKAPLAPPNYSLSHCPLPPPPPLPKSLSPLKIQRITSCRCCQYKQSLLVQVGPTAPPPPPPPPPAATATPTPTPTASPIATATATATPAAAPAATAAATQATIDPATAVTTDSGIGNGGKSWVFPRSPTAIIVVAALLVLLALASECK